MLVDWMKEHNLLDKEVRLTISLEKIVRDKYKNGNDVRYFRCLIDGNDVSQMMADFVHMNHSTAKTTNGYVIVHGSGMDMAFYLQNEAYWAGERNGYPKMFNSQFYKEHKH